MLLQASKMYIHHKYMKFFKKNIKDPYWHALIKKLDDGSGYVVGMAALNA